jgi:hypothetical protein
VKPEVIGVVLDAGPPESGGLASRWRELTAKLRRRGYHLPGAPETDGTILDGGLEKPRIGFWFMPNNSEAGMLEDFLLDCAPQRAIEVARRAVDLALETQVATFKSVHHSKAVIHTYLAWQDEPGRPLGQSVTKRTLQGDVPTAIRFADWLRRLFA